MDSVPFHSKKVPSLESLCIDFICHNIDMVDSFSGFPDIVGELIAKRCISRDIFLVHYCNEQRFKAIELFVSAYGGDMVSQFKFTTKGVRFLNYYSDVLGKCFGSLVALDLSNCGLKDEDVLCDISSLKCLEHLNLSHNKLSDNGFGKLLSRFRASRSGQFEVLKTFNLVENNLTDKNLRTILKFPKLDVLRFSQFEREVNPCSAKRYSLGFGFSVTKKPVIPPIGNVVYNSGFEFIAEDKEPVTEYANAGLLVDALCKWINTFEHRIQPKSSIKNNENTAPQLFYARSKASIINSCERENKSYWHFTIRRKNCRATKASEQLPSQIERKKRKLESSTGMQKQPKLKSSSGFFLDAKNVEELLRFL